MAYNNTVILTGNIGAEPRVIETEATKFAAFSLATTDSYQDKDDKWHENEPVWHNIIVFNPRLIEILKTLKKGSRIELKGSLSYKSYEVELDGKVITKKEASVVAKTIEQAPLVKK